MLKYEEEPDWQEIEDFYRRIVEEKLGGNGVFK